MSYALPLSIFASLETKLGKEDALKVSHAIEESVRVVEQRAEEIAIVKTAEVKLSVEKDLSTKLMSKEDGAKLETKIEARFAQLETKVEARFAQVDIKFAQAEAKSTKQFYLTIAAIVILNPHAIDLLSKLLGLAK